MWKTIENHPNYEVSDSGQVRRKGREEPLRANPNRKNGYLRVELDGQHCCVHKLVFEAFRFGNLQGLEVTHKDGDKQNNAVENLTGVPKRGSGRKDIW